MAISVLLLIICALVLLFLVPHSRYGLPMFFMILGIILTTISVLFQYYSSSSYVPPYYLPFRSIDIFLYRYVGQSFRVPMKYMQLIRNFGVVAYLTGISALIDVIRRNLKEGHKNTSMKAFIISKSTGIIISLSYLFFYSTHTAYIAYLKYYRLKNQRSQQRLITFFSFIHLVFNIAIAIYMFYPLAFFFINIIKKRVTCFLSTTIIILSSVTLINIYFYHFIFIGLFRNSTTHVFQTGFWFFNRITKIPSAYISTYPILAFAILLFIILSINGFFALDLVSYSKNRILKKQIDSLNYNLKDVFHSEKNLMFSINILANEVISDYGSDEARKKLERIIDISSKQMRTLSESLNDIKQLHIRPNAVDLKAITDSAIMQSNIPADIELIKDYCSFPVLCTLDQYHTLHALSNLIINSADSLSTLQDENKKIIITIEASKEWVYWSIWDNGSGIDPKSVKKLMMPFVSTKSKNTNWGIGLSYVFRVINSQLGQMHITGSQKSSNHYARVEILLPRRK